MKRLTLERREWRSDRTRERDAKESGENLLAFLFGGLLCGLVVYLFAWPV